MPNDIQTVSSCTVSPCMSSPAYIHTYMYVCTCMYVCVPMRVQTMLPNMPNDSQTVRPCTVSPCMSSPRNAAAPTTMDSERQPGERPKQCAQARHVIASSFFMILYFHYDWYTYPTCTYFFVTILPVRLWQERLPCTAAPRAPTGHSQARAASP